MSRVTIQARTVLLCREHAGLVAIKMPRTWEELCAIFPGGAEADERRAALPRRLEFDDRRTFPPRPEGRRASLGRRRDDPRD